MRRETEILFLTCLVVVVVVAGVSFVVIVSFVGVCLRDRNGANVDVVVELEFVRRPNPICLMLFVVVCSQLDVSDVFKFE